MNDPTEVEQLRTERDALAQAIHDARGILGFDNDGDAGPHTSNYIQFAEFHRADAQEVRRDNDAALRELEAVADRATDLADKYATALVQIHEALAPGTPGAINRARVVIAGLDSGAPIPA